MNILKAPQPLLLTTLFLIATSLCLAGSASGKEIVRTVEQSYFAGDAQKLEIDLVGGIVRVEGTDDRNAHVELILRCKRQNVDKCRRRAERLRLVPRQSRGILSIRLRRTPRGLAQGIEAELKIKIPRRMELELDMGGGDVFIEGMTSHVEVDSAAGSVDLVHHQDRVQRIKADVGVGSAELWTRDSKITARGFPKGIDWQGAGEAQIAIDVAGGDIRIRLQ